MSRAYFDRYDVFGEPLSIFPEPPLPRCELLPLPAPETVHGMTGELAGAISAAHAAENAEWAAEDNRHIARNLRMMRAHKALLAKLEKAAGAPAREAA